jgi:hypothetical protein
MREDLDGSRSVDSTDSALWGFLQTLDDSQFNSHCTRLTGNLRIDRGCPLRIPYIYQRTSLSDLLYHPGKPSARCWCWRSDLPALFFSAHAGHVKYQYVCLNWQRGQITHVALVQSAEHSPGGASISPKCSQNFIVPTRHTSYHTPGTGCRIPSCHIRCLPNSKFPLHLRQMQRRPRSEQYEPPVHIFGVAGGRILSYGRGTHAT